MNKREEDCLVRERERERERERKREIGVPITVIHRNPRN